MTPEERLTRFLFAMATMETKEEYRRLMREEYEGAHTASYSIVGSSAPLQEVVWLAANRVLGGPCESPTAPDEGKLYPHKTGLLQTVSRYSCDHEVIRFDGFGVGTRISRVVYSCKHPCQCCEDYRLCRA